MGVADGDLLEVLDEAGCHCGSRGDWEVQWLGSVVCKCKGNSWVGRREAGGLYRMARRLLTWVANITCSWTEDPRVKGNEQGGGQGSRSLGGVVRMHCTRRGGQAQA